MSAQRPPSMTEWMRTVRREWDAEALRNGWARCVPMTYDGVQEIRRLERADHDLAGAVRAHDFAVAELHAAEDRILAARTKLQLSADESPADAWLAYQELSSANPKDELELLRAYWVIKRAATMQLRDEEATRERLDRVSAPYAAADRLGWPTDWLVAFARKWEELGGTGASACAWADAGWSALEVLTNESFTSPWNADVPTRVQATAVPLRSGPDAGRSWDWMVYRLTVDVRDPRLPSDLDEDDPTWRGIAWI